MCASNDRKCSINHPAKPTEDIGKLLEKNVAVFAIRDDLQERGIDPENCFEGVKLIQRSEVAGLMEVHEQVCRW